MHKGDVNSQFTSPFLFYVKTANCSVVVNMYKNQPAFLYKFFGEFVASYIDVRCIIKMYFLYTDFCPVRQSKKEMERMKKMLSLLICICMLFSMLPMGTLALANSGAKIEAAYDAARLDDGYKEIGSIFYFDADEPENSASGDWDDLLKISGVTMGKSYKIMTAYNDGSSATTVWQDVTADINADGQVTEEEAKFVAQHGSGKPIVVADDYPFSPYSADSKISYYFTERKTMDTPGYIDGVVVGKDYPMYGPNAVIYRPLNGATVTVDGQEESSGYDENYGGVDGEGGNGYFSVESNTFVAGDTKIADIRYGNVKYSAFQQVNAPQRYIIDLADVFTVSNATIYKDDTLIENDVVIYNDDAEYTLEFSTSSANDNLIATRVELKFYKADGSYYTSREFSSDGELTGLFKCTFTPSTLVGLDDGSKITVTFIDNKGSRYNEHDSGLRIKASPDASIEDEVFGDLPVFAADEQRERWNALRAVNFATVNDIPLEIGKFFNLDTQLTTEDYFGRYDDNNECNGIGITVKYVSSDESVAKVYENGYIEGISEGTATITAYIMPADSTFDGKNYLSDYPDFEGNTSLILDVQIGVTVTEALPDISYKDYIIEQHDLTHIQNVFDGVAEVTESGDTITVKFTSDIYGYILLNEGCKVVFDLNGKTIDPGDSNEAICLKHYEGINLTITGEGTIKKGNHNVIYVGYQNNLYFAPAKGMHYFTLKQGENDVFSAEENTEKKSYGTIGNADDLVMTHGVYSSTYTIVFNANGGEGTMESQSAPVEHSTNLVPNAFTKEGMDFAGWALSPDGAKVYSDEGSVKDLAKEGESITLYAAWIISNKDYEIFTDVLTDVQNTFEGVAEVTKDDTTSVVTIKLTSDIYGRLHFNDNSGKFVLDLNGKTIDPVIRDESICLNHGFGGEVTITGEGTIKKGKNNTIYASRGTLYFAVAEGYDYFTLKAGASNVFDAKNYETKEKNGYFKVSGDIVMTQGTSLGCYTVTFDANGGSGTMADQVIDVGEATELSANTFTYSGKVFEGWATSTDGEVVYTDKEVVTDITTKGQEITLYAVWQDEVIPNPEGPELDAIPHSHPVCGEACTHSDAHTNIEWTPWEDDETLPEESGNYYLTQDVDLDIYDTSWRINEDINICLNGHTITRDENTICLIKDDVTFSITDCVTEGEMFVSGNVLSLQGNNSTVNLYAGSIVSDDENAVIDQESTGSVFNVYGGYIENRDDSPAIAARYTTVNLYGGEIYAYGDHAVRVRENGMINLCGNTKLSHGEGFDNIICHYTSLIDASGYTGDALTICYESENIQAGDVIVINVTDETADKFALSSTANAGYVLEREGNNLVVAEVSDDNEEDEDENTELEYYLVGKISMVDTYECKEEYKFVDGKLDIVIDGATYVGVMDSEGNFYFPKAWIDFDATEGVLYSGYSSVDAMHIGNSGSYTLWLTVNNDGTLTLTTFEPIHTYTVSFDANGGTVSPADAVTDKDGKLAELPTPERAKYTFKGWFTAANGGTEVTVDTVYTEDTTIYAQWKRKSTGGGGGGGSVSRPVVKDEDKTETEKEEVKDVETKEPENVGTTGEGAATSGSTTPASKTAFTDVSADAWYSDEVAYVVENGLMNGISEDEFGPDVLLTRAMLVTMLYRNAGEPAVNRSIPFADLDMDYYYVNAVIWAQQNGIVTGITETEFGPNANITREQIATIMFRYAQYKGMNAITMEENLHFEDADEIFEYAITSMNWAVGTGLMNGRTETTINPKDNATRAEIATILQRFMENNK